MNEKVNCAECGREWTVPVHRTDIAYVCASHVYSHANTKKPGPEGRVNTIRRMAELARKHKTAGVSLVDDKEG